MELLPAVEDVAARSWPLRISPLPPSTPHLARQLGRAQVARYSVQGKAANPARAPGEREQKAVDASEEQSDGLRAREIYNQMAAERQLAEEKMRAVWAEVQTETMRVWQEVMLRRKKVMADLLDKWNKVMFG